MPVSDKDAFLILGLPLGINRDAICERYQRLYTKLSASSCQDSKMKLEMVTAAYHQLIPESLRHRLENGVNSKNKGNNRNKGNLTEDKRKVKNKKSKDKKQDFSSRNDELSDEADYDDDKVKDCLSSSSKKSDRSPSSTNNNNNNGSSLSSSSSIRSDSDMKQDKQKDKFPGPLQYRQIQARQLAMQGNEEANKGDYKQAIEYFTKAISLDSKDHRFFGNRSFCYTTLHQYIEALNDAEIAIKLAPEWPKGYFRKGRALKGLGKLVESEKAFKQVLKYDHDCDDAKHEITKVNRRRLREMGFTALQAKAAIKKYKDVQTSLDYLLSGEFKNLIGKSTSSSSDLSSDDEDSDDGASQSTPPPPEPTKAVTKTKPEPSARAAKQQQQPQKVKQSKTLAKLSQAKPPSKAQQKAQQQQVIMTQQLEQEPQPETKMNPQNVRGLTSLWVGNVVPEVGEKDLINLFSRYGLVTSVRLLKDRYCAFVNFGDKTSAGHAMEALQGHELYRSKLLIKFPDHPNVNGVQHIVNDKNRNLNNKAT